MQTGPTVCDTIFVLAFESLRFQLSTQMQTGLYVTHFLCSLLKASVFNCPHKITKNF